MLAADLCMKPGSAVSLLTPTVSLAWGCTAMSVGEAMGGHTFTTWLSTEAVTSRPSGPNEAKCNGGFCGRIILHGYVC